MRNNRLIMADIDKEQFRHYFNRMNYLRVLRIARTPDIQEFRKVATIVSVSVTVAGLLGYILFVLVGLLPM